MKHASEFTDITVGSEPMGSKLEIADAIENNDLNNTE